MPDNPFSVCSARAELLQLRLDRRALAFASDRASSTRRTVGEMLVALGEVVVDELVEEVAGPPARQALLSSGRTCATIVAGSNGLVR